MNYSQQEESLLGHAIDLLNAQYLESKDFNGFLDSGEPIAIDQAVYQTSKVLFWVDPDGYEDRKTAWKNDTNQVKHEQALDLIRTSKLTVTFEDLLRAVERGRVVPFVGAGLSKPLGMPLWGEALEEILGLLPDADKPTISSLIASGQYLEAAQQLAEHNSIRLSNFISTKYRTNSVDKIVGPLRHLPRIAKGCVVTTNFDDAIEKAYSDVKFDGYMHGDQEGSLFFPRLVKGDHCILKLHGDAQNPRTHILTEAQYQNAYGEAIDFQRPLPKALRQIYISQSLLFLGCRLDEDWTMKLFATTKEEGGYNVPPHYAVVEEPATTEQKLNKETRLLDLDIHPIWYPNGAHQMVERIIDLVADVAEKRFVFKG
jgi:SIR2-like domain